MTKSIAIFAKSIIFMQKSKVHGDTAKKIIGGKL
jgi:hypothetical protein